MLISKKGCRWWNVSRYPKLTNIFQLSRGAEPVRVQALAHAVSGRDAQVLTAGQICLCAPGAQNSLEIWGVQSVMIKTICTWSNLILYKSSLLAVTLIQRPAWKRGEMRYELSNFQYGCLCLNRFLMTILSFDHQLLPAPGADLTCSLACLLWWLFCVGGCQTLWARSWGSGKVSILSALHAPVLTVELHRAGLGSSSSWEDLESCVSRPTFISPSETGPSSGGWMRLERKPSRGRLAL